MSHLLLSCRRVLAAAAAVVALLLGASSPLPAQPSKPMAAPAPVGDPYPLATCAVSDEPLGAMGDPIVFVHEGREVRFCCEACVEPFEKEPATYLAAVDAKIIAAQRADYPTDMCVVGGEKLGAMGEPDEVVVGNRLVRLCCAGCRKELGKHPEEYLAKLNAAVIAREAATYPLATCLVSGDPLDGEGAMKPVDYVVGIHMYRLCCVGCVRDLHKDPVGFEAKLAAARTAGSPAAVPAEGANSSEAVPAAADAK